ncbi:hypothetical protein V2J09_002676 [Rumex salicifolius]
MEERQRRKTRMRSGTTSFSINDHGDVVLEVLKRLDARSLGVAACVCRLWSALARNDVVWEHICFRHTTPPPSPASRALVISLGGYRRLYMLCVHPALSSLRRRLRSRRADAESTRRVWTRHGAQLSLSLFCVDYYERLGGGAAAGIRSDASTLSLMFLCKPVNV